MSNVVNKHKYNNQSNNSIAARVGQQQSINPRGSTPSENHSRPDHRLTYSNATRQGIPPTHDSVINKSLPVSGNTVQQVVLAQQPNLSSQVPSVNPSGPPMPAPTGPNSGANPLVLQQTVPQVMSQTGARFPAPAFHQHQRPQQRGPLLTHRSQNTVPVPTSSGVVQAAVQQNVGPNNPMTHPQHQHYYMVTPQMPQPMSQIINQQHMSHAVPYPQSRTMHHQGVHQYYAIPFAPNQQPAPFGQQTYPYMYPTPYHPSHGQPTPQMMTPQIHPGRGAQVSNSVIQAQIPVQVSGTVNSSNEANEPAQMQQKPLQKRVKQVAIITDPNSGKNLDIEELASKDVSKNQTVVATTNESHSGASNLINASSTSTPKSDTNFDIAVQFATQVVQKATEKLPHNTNSNTNTNTNEIVTSAPNATSKLETEPLVANSNRTSSELSERNDKNSDSSEPDLTDGNTLVNNNNSSISASISHLNTENDVKLLNNTSAQNLVENNSQNSVEPTSGQEIQQNGDQTDSSNQLIEDNDELAKDHQIQKVNNNQRRKEALKKADNRILTDELEDIKVNNDSTDVSDNVKVSENVESKTQTTTDPSSSVMLSSLPKEKEETTSQNEVICNNISENELHTKDSEDVGPNEVNNSETTDDNQTETPDLPVPVIKTLPDLPYKDDQWSPNNPEGRKSYDRDFLVAVRQSAMHLERPEELNNVPDIIRKAHQEQSNSGPGISDDPFLPGYASKHQNFSARMGMAQINRRQSQPGRGHQEKQRKVISTSLTQDVKLHTTDNAWKPSKLASSASDPDEQETLELLKKIRGILNKLTPQKYEDLVKQIMGFKLDTEDRLKRVLDLVFEKAVDEPAFCLQYANLCKNLSQVTVAKEDNSSKGIKFQNLLLSKCQKEFEADVYASIENLKERQKEIEDCQDPAKKKMLFEILDDDMRRARKRSLGNIKLIGELYKLHMLKANIMVQCIDNLCKEKDDESLECLCALLKTIGEQIENEAANHPKNNYTLVIDNFFTQMDKIANQQLPDVKISSRVRFMLRDVIDMRKNNWKARRDENLPKMIDEIHREAKKEDEQRAQDLHQHAYQKSKEEKERRQKGGRQQNDSNQDQWQTVARKSQSMQSSIPSIDWNKMRQMQQSDNVQLGPQGPSSWSFGSRGGAQASQTRTSGIEEKQVNRFSPLDSGISERKSQKSNNIPSRDSSRGRSNQQNYQPSGGGRRPQGKSDREDAISLARQFSKQSASDSSPVYSNSMSKNSSRSASREHSAPSSRNSSMRRETPDIEFNPPNQLKGSDISEQDLQRISEASIKEYLSLKKFSEPVIDITKYCNDSNVHLYVSTAINCALEISSQNDQFAIGNLFCHLIVNNIIKIEHFYKGLNSILEMAEDYQIDVPLFWDYIGDVLAPIFVELPANKRKQFLLDAAQPCKANNLISKLIVKTVKAIAKLTSEVKANELWSSSNLSWEDFLGPEQDVKKFVEANNVDFTLKGPITSTNSDQSLQRFREEVIKLVRLNKSDDEIQSFISKYFNASQTNDPRFTSALFSAVVRGCLTAPPDSSFPYVLDSTLLVNYSPLLAKFFGGNPDVELQALMILQELMEELKHPSNLLFNIFQTLYDNGVISQEAFLQWEKYENNSPGKGIAVSSVMRFLTWLRENEEDDEDNDAAGS